ncbi:MAG: hypothetical protein V3U19_03740 [Thermodesulfobacteriota bacterium]
MSQDNEQNIRGVESITKVDFIPTNNKPYNGVIDPFTGTGGGSTTIQNVAANTKLYLQYICLTVGNSTNFIADLAIRAAGLGLRHSLIRINNWSDTDVAIPLQFITPIEIIATDVIRLTVTSGSASWGVSGHGYTISV